MSYSKMGLTEREKAIWPPKDKPLDDVWIEIALGLLVLVILATIIHFTMEPKIQNTETHVGMSDRAQETLYCKEALAGYPVKDATVQALQDHCKNFN